MVEVRKKGVFRIQARGELVKPHPSHPYSFSSFSLFHTSAKMTDTSKFLDGNCVYFAMYNEWFEYRSRSDALVASLVLHFNIPLKTLEPIFELLCCGNEYRAADCSFSRPADVYSQLRALRTEIALERSGTTEASSDSTVGFVAGFPNQDIFQGVIDSLVMERQRLVENQYFPSYVFDERARNSEDDERDSDVGCVTDTLECMRLVHRTWSILAQQALRRCAIIKNRYSRGGRLYRVGGPAIVVLSSPWLTFADTVIYEDPEELEEDMLILLKGIILHPYQRTLQMLHLNLELDPPSESKRGTNSIADTIKCIGTLGVLKTLSLHFSVEYEDDGVKERNRFMIAVCRVLKHLHRLELLRLVEKGGGDGREAGRCVIPKKLRRAHPASSLKTLHIDLKNPKYKFVSWLTRPRAGFQPEHIVLFTSSFFPKLLSALQPSIPSLRSFSINAECYRVRRHDDLLGFLTKTFREAQSVETLILRFDTYMIDHVDDVEMGELMSSIPRTTRRLSLLFKLEPQFKESDHSTWEAKLDELVSRFASRVNESGQLCLILNTGSSGEQRRYGFNYIYRAQTSSWSRQ